MSGFPCALPLFAALQFVPTAPQAVLTGDDRALRTMWRNPDDEPARVELRGRLLQTGSATVAPVGELPSKELQVLPHQTIVETDAVSFPAVTSATRFMVQWVDDANAVLGTIDVVVYPRNLLRELQSLAESGSGARPALAVIDPEGRLKPALRSAEVEFSDLSDEAAAGLDGQLLLVAADTIGAEQVRTRAGKCRGIVWLQAPREQTYISIDNIRPSFFTVRQKKSAIVVAERALLTDLAENPVAQLYMVALAQQALHPAPFPLSPTFTDPQ